MPTSLVGLLVFVVLLAPGLTYTVQREKRFVPRSYSALRETASIVLASVIAVSATMAVFAVVRVILPDNTPDIGQLIDRPADYWRQHYTEVSLWVGALLSLACMGAALVATPPGPVQTHWAKLPRLLQPASIERMSAESPIRYESAWALLSNRGGSDEAVWVACELEDGSYFSGPLFSLNPDPVESGDRELVITAPITYRSPTSDDPEVTDFHAVAISARRARYVAFTYVSRPATTDAR